MAQPLPNEDIDPIGELYRRIASVEAYCNDLERRIRNFDSPLALSRIDPTTYANPYEGQRGIDVADEQHTWYSDGQWRKAKPGPVYHMKVFGDNLVVTTGDASNTVNRMNFWAIEEDIDGMELMNGAGAPYIGVEINVTTVSSSGIVQVQLRNVTNGNVDMLSTRVQIDASEEHSRTAATVAVVNAANAGVSHGDKIAIDIDAAGTGAMGLGLVARFQVPA